MTKEKIEALARIDCEASRMIDSLPDDSEVNQFVDDFNTMLLGLLTLEGLTLDEYHEFVMEKFAEMDYND